MESTISAAESSHSSDRYVKSVVGFICERLSLAVVAIGTVVMVIVFAVVEGNSTRLGFFPILFPQNSNVVQVVPGPQESPEARRRPTTTSTPIVRAGEFSNSRKS